MIFFFVLLTALLLKTLQLNTQHNIYNEIRTIKSWLTGETDFVAFRKIYN